MIIYIGFCAFAEVDPFVRNPTSYYTMWFKHFYFRLHCSVLQFISEKFCQSLHPTDYSKVNLIKTGMHDIINVQLWPCFFFFMVDMFYIVQQSRCHIAALFQFFSKPTLLFHILYDCFLLYEQHGMVWYNRYNIMTLIRQLNAITS